MSVAKKQQHTLDMQLSILDKTGGYTSDAVTGRYIVGMGNIFTGDRQGVAYAMRHLAYSGDKYGLWIDTETNIVYIDRVYGTDNLELAMMLAKDNKEIAIFDRHDMVEIRIDYSEVA